MQGVPNPSVLRMLYAFGDVEKQYCEVPSALVNDNFQGYMHPLIVQHKVRWIEAIAACPFLTTLVTYYVEGHPNERHHICDEVLGQQARAYAV